MQLNRKPELLAPAGTLDGVLAVLDAGADAVYVGGKALNMRMHRASYNLSDAELAEAVAAAHERGAKLFVTVNSLLFEHELDQARGVLEMLGELTPDALIVQDLAVAAMARETCVHIPLHASTMMNVQSIETAAALKLMGFKRVIASRDIPLHEIRRIGEAAGIETECFLHGDMCVAQSSQCYGSGILFGESSNRGRCRKSCRWEWELIPPDGHEPLPAATKGYLLARKDLSLLGHVPELVRSGVASLKIEGRMRSPQFLTPLVQAYRAALDSYFADPANYRTDPELLADVHRRRVRELSTCLALHNEGPRSIDTTGSREPRLFSVARREAELTMPDGEGHGRGTSARMEIAVHVATAAAAEAAVEAGADAIYFGGELMAGQDAGPGAGAIVAFAQRVGPRTRVAVLGTRIADERDLAEWRWLLGRLGAGVGVGVSSLGALDVAREMRCRDLLADFSMNVTNSAAADELSTVGVTRVTASVELSFAELAEFAAACRMPVEMIGHGPLPSMVLEHCLIAAAAGHGPQEFCDASCRTGPWHMRDTAGQDHRLETDRRCRNHLYMAKDVCVLPNLHRLAAVGVAAVRIEAQFDPPETVAAATAAYRRSAEAVSRGEPIAADADVEAIVAATGRPVGDGALDFARIPPEAPETGRIA